MDIERIRANISKLRLADKLSLVGGCFVTNGISGKVESVDFGDPTELYEPTALALGCTFSDELCERASRSIAANAEPGGACGGISAGLVTEPMRPDAVECFSEDPILAARLLGAFARGGRYIFFGALGQGDDSTRTVDARALAEVYLYPLMRAGKCAAGLVMDGGTLNGERVDASRKMYDAFAKLTANDAVIFTRGDAFIGAYMLGDKKSTAALKKRLARAVEAGELHESKIDASIERLVAAAQKQNPLAPETSAFDMRELVFDSAVLLENKNGVLPVADGDIALFGDGGYFDDGKDLDIRPVSGATNIPSDTVAVFAVTDYENGVNEETKRAVSACAKNNKTVVVVCGGAAVDLGFADGAAAVLYMPYAPRRADIVELVRGKKSPRGRLPFTWCNAIGDYPSGNTRFDDRGDYRYCSVFNGYAYFENFAYSSSVRYRFGHGLDYTTFEIKSLKTSCRERAVTVDLDVTNAGASFGSAVVEAFVSYVGDNAFGLKKRFAGFKRVDLAVGECVHIAIDIDLNELNVYDPTNGVFVPLGGKYIVDVGFSASDIRLSGAVKATGVSRPVGPTPSDVPSYYAAGSGKAFEPSAPELEKLFGVPFVKKPVITEKPNVSERKRKSVARKTVKTTPRRRAGLALYKNGCIQREKP